MGYGNNIKKFIDFFSEITAMSKFLPFQNNSNMMNNGIMEIDGSCYDFELSKDLFPDLDPGYGSFSGKQLALKSYQILDFFCM